MRVSSSRSPSAVIARKRSSLAVSRVGLALSLAFLFAASAGGGCGGNEPDGGESTGGAATGGSQASGGARTGGAAATGGDGAGGSVATGGARTGGTSTGGTSTGGTGGSNLGGAIATGGRSTGGAMGGRGGAGGSSATGGQTSTGGAAGGRGGNAATGGAGTGGAGTGGAGTGGAGSSGCNEPPAAPALVGWAAVSGGGVTTTTGGGNAAPTTVTTASQFTSAIAGTSAAVIYVKGSLTGNFSVGSNKTIVGLCGAELHGHLELGGSVNVILRNIKVVGYGVGDCKLDPSYDASVGCSSGEDAISVQKNAHHIWIDHCDVSDGTDGNLDITNGANYVTVSWTKFHYTARTDTQGSDSTGASGHRYSNLVGGTDTPKTYDDANALNVTWHHDWWADRVVERQPRVRFGKNHLFNNLWTSTGDNYCVRAGIKAQILIEKSAFVNVTDPHEFNSTDDQKTASITARNNLYSGSTSGNQATNGSGPAFTNPPYTYTADDAAGVQAAVQSGAGPH